jgi:hypothetical protein
MKPEAVFYVLAIVVAGAMVNRYVIRPMWPMTAAA